jgi:GNAT superfamily N-acetyltransferase
VVEASKPFHKAIRADRPCLRTTLTLERITSENLAKAIAAAWQIFPYETHAEGFWPEVTYKMAIEQHNPRFAYYVARDTEKIVGITGHYPAKYGQPKMWLGWFGVLPAERRKGYGSKILLATCEIVGGFGISSFHIYSGDCEEERAAHRLYLRTGFEQTGRGQVDGEPVLYFKTKLPLVASNAATTGVFPGRSQAGSWGHLYKEKTRPRIEQGQKTDEFSFVLKPSKIAGVGVFATHDIHKGAILNFWNKEDSKFVKREDVPEDKKFFYNTYCIEERNGFWCPLQFNRMSIGWYINHSDLPNCNTDGYECRANRDIKTGEELTIDYRYLSHDPKEFNNLPQKIAKV